ncbi:uncharacterized protein LOC110255902 [Sus scrofa]|uniref:uncharacterized protein LOC110255902 n=1 Tax=Sus scrofa TaxID=9823 RepID=UPI000A2B8875|nr:uncharacterized protein LOC110255902 [Sus scrofa]
MGAFQLQPSSRSLWFSGVFTSFASQPRPQERRRAQVRCAPQGRRSRGSVERGACVWGGYPVSKQAQGTSTSSNAALALTKEKPSPHLLRAGLHSLLWARRKPCPCLNSELLMAEDLPAQTVNTWMWGQGALTIVPWDLILHVTGHQYPARKMMKPRVREAKTLSQDLTTRCSRSHESMATDPALLQSLRHEAGATQMRTELTHTLEHTCSG